MSASDASPSEPSATVGSLRNAATPDLSVRFVAALIDGVVASVLGALLGWIPLVGGVVGAAYVVLRDGFEVGPVRYRSVGKWVMGLHPKRLDGRPMDLETSIRRNAILGISALATLAGSIPLLGWILGPMLSVAAFLAVAAEVYLLATRSDQRRWGDRYAGTRVIDSGDSMV
jgi:uncharacterized RDD family membrane protein YckC